MAENRQVDLYEEYVVKAQAQVIVQIMTKKDDNGKETIGWKGAFYVNGMQEATILAPFVPMNDFCRGGDLIQAAQTVASEAVRRLLKARDEVMNRKDGEGGGGEGH